MIRNKKYSGKGFPYHGLSFKSIQASEFNNTEIYASVFYQEWVEGDTKVMKDIFPAGMTGVVFFNCNLDNVYVDETNNTINGGSHRKIKVQNDWEDWELDNSLKPSEPLNKKERLRAGVSIDPLDLPSKKFTQEEREVFDNNLNEKYQEYKRNR